jgi:mitochondrial distribution and morphology protein 31
MIKGRLFAHFWESANPVSASVWYSPLSSYASTYPNLARGFVSQNRPRVSSSFPPRTSRNAITRGFASSGIFFGTIPLINASIPVVVYPSTVERTFCRTKLLGRQNLSPLVQKAWRSAVHSPSRQKQRAALRRNKSSSTGAPNGNKTATSTKETAQLKMPPEKARDRLVKEDEAPPATNNYFHLPNMPKMPHRPTKEELLAAATGFWSRLRVRFKWFSIRSLRPWNIDDWSAFVSWLMLGHIVWILVGTTTFFSLLIFAINTVVAQGKFLTQRALETC